MSERPIDDPAVVDDLHLLVHPGWGMNHSTELFDDGRELFDRYGRRADAMAEGDMLLAYLWKPTEPGKGEVDRFVHERICGLRQKLGKRMIVVSNGMKLFYDLEGVERDFLRVKDIAEVRGHRIDRATRIIAYGESFRACVPNTARVLAKALQSFRRPVISAHDTNVGVRIGETRERQRARFGHLAELTSFDGVDISWAVPEE